MDISAIYYDGWKDLVRIGLAAPVIYFTIIAFIRLAGKRSTSQMNNFDWVVTVALGSIAGAGITSNSVTALEALFAIAILLLIQWALTFLLARNAALESLVKSSPRLLVYRGEYLVENIHDERLTKSEVLAALRENGLTHVSEAELVVLETDASFSVVARENTNVSPEHLAQSVVGVPGYS
jgi:uncharacterized membrane protein YcaP (DUF421 family)